MRNYVLKNGKYYSERKEVIFQSNLIKSLERVLEILKKPEVMNPFIEEDLDGDIVFSWNELATEDEIKVYKEREAIKIKDFQEIRRKQYEQLKKEFENE